MVTYKMFLAIVLPIICMTSQIDGQNNSEKFDENSISACPEKCNCLDAETVVCKNIVQNDLFQNMFSINTTKVNLQGNQLKTLPKDPFMNLPKLKHLNLAGNELEELPTFLSFLPLLESIDVSANRLTKIEANSLEENKNLQIIDLSHNQISFFDDGVLENKPSLTKLNLYENNLQEIPKQVAGLKNLKELKLGKNSIETIPDSILQKCSNLEEFNLQGNPLKSFHIDAFAGLSKLKKLILSGVRDNINFPNLNGTNNLKMLRIDRSKISSVPSNLCTFCPQLEGLEMKSNQLHQLPDLKECKELKIIDLGHNQITDLNNQASSPFETLANLHDLILHHNKIKQISKTAFLGLKSLQILDLMANQIVEIDDEAFEGLESLTDLNLGMNTFSKFPSKGLHNLAHVKTHNNPNLIDFPGSNRFPKIQTLVLSYAYHCCQYIPSTFDNLISESGDFGDLRETVIFPGDGHQSDSPVWEANVTEPMWAITGHSNDTSVLWGIEHPTIFVVPPPGIQCTPAPGTFLPCNDLFDWWTLRCSVWIVFCLALLGNGCVVLVLVASRGKMDVPRFLVCNLAAADFFMGLYLGFLAIVDASTLGEFRQFAISWQFSSACQVAGFFGVLSSVLSIFTLSVITLERNYAITHAMHLNKRLSLRHASYIMICGWIYAILMASMPLIGVSDYSKFAVCLPFETGDALSLGYVIFLTLINGVGFSILMGCYLKMYCAIRGSQAWNSNDSRIAKRMALLVFTDFICWFPIALIALTACFGVHLITLEQAKVFTVFVLPLNSCFNPFLYAILTKQFKKDCVMICKTIEESRVTRGIGRCRHSSNFSNRQTPANTNSLNSGSGSHGSHSNPQQTKGHTCNCNLKKPKTPGSILAANWPFNKLKKIFLEYKDSGELGGGTLTSSNEYAQQIAEVQLKQKAKRHASLSSENFSSSRSDSWRLQGLHRPDCLQQQNARRRDAHGQPGSGQFNHRRRNSWTVTRKPSEESQMSSSRNDSNSNSNSTQTWRMSRSSVSSEMNNIERNSGILNDCIPANAPIDPATGKLNISLVHNQRIHGGGTKTRVSPCLTRRASENAAKPKLTRQPAILADGDSVGSTKSVTFKDPHYPGCLVIGGARRLIAAATEVGACPLHGHEIQGTFYEKLAESSHEESDMEPSDTEPEDQMDSAGKNLTKQTGIFFPRKLSTIASKDKDSKEDASPLEAEAPPGVLSPCDPVPADNTVLNTDV